MYTFFFDTPVDRRCSYPLLVPLAEPLDLEAFPLHSQVEQRQRLKNLDRYIHPSFSQYIIYSITDSNQHPTQSF